ncbi:hypothetical protein RFI_17311 [Reticulomyxa filosa]|uniref:Uncharacterized protein n=1 Tax=Reticulomyxa filosa TaxID=46433 RepID=X6N3N9_RETFI|nr:hypothetical protein RFI_17311 [Reticulomyxa filosa]|eukprot:ETO19907.1 hypothetical protein RFI_17311 [Reticulomyxa filosa]
MKHGVLFINIADGYCTYRKFGGHRFITQHDHALDILRRENKSEYICNAQLLNVASVIACIERAMTVPLPSYVPQDVQWPSLFERVKKWVIRPLLLRLGQEHNIVRYDHPTGNEQHQIHRQCEPFLIDSDERGYWTPVCQAQNNTDPRALMCGKDQRWDSLYT